jgi:sugar transferase (PEP-CTERM system associated)
MKKEKISEKPSDCPIIGDFSQISSICREAQVDRIIVALDERRGKLPLDQLLECRLRGVRVEEGVGFSENLTGKLMVENLRPSSLIFADGFRRSQIIKQLKRYFDIGASLLTLIFSFPCVLAVSIAILWESKGPIFYRQERVGQDGRVFPLLKFRSMRVDAEGDEPVWAGVDDSRITRVGKIIRKLRLDEIPQVINVLKGEMSFVGPRPERPFFTEKLIQEVPFYSHRHTVKPGITGWAQICYPYGASKEDALEKLKYDLYYIKHMSPYLDFMILLETIKTVLFGQGSR